MVNRISDVAQPTDAGARGTDEQSRENPTAPFVLDGEVTFAPFFFPKRTQITKQREKNKTSGFCGGQNVSDKGAKNRQIHVQGKASGEYERIALDDLADYGGSLDLLTAAWSGEVQVEEVEYEGPTGWHPPTGSLYWDYRIDLVSTGRDEPEQFEPIQAPPAAVRAVREDQENDT